MVLLIFLIASIALASLDNIISIFMIIGLVSTVIRLRKHFSHMENDNIYYKNNDNTDNIFR